jgi:hypothetical protein
MYIGTISSLYDNPFKFNIKSRELPFGFMSKVKNEVYVLTDHGTRILSIELESDQEIIYIKTSSLTLTYNIDKLKVKTILKNVIIKKSKDQDVYDLIFEHMSF